MTNDEMEASLKEKMTIFLAGYLVCEAFFALLKRGSITSSEVRVRIHSMVGEMLEREIAKVEEESFRMSCMSIMREAENQLPSSKQQRKTMIH
jgi:exopolyphosphatase/pppGpp-phosphohydrolase